MASSALLNEQRLAGGVPLDVSIGTKQPGGSPTQQTQHEAVLEFVSDQLRPNRKRP